MVLYPRPVHAPSDAHRDHGALGERLHWLRDVQNEAAIESREGPLNDFFLA